MSVTYDCHSSQTLWACGNHWFDSVMNYFLRKNYFKKNIKIKLKLKKLLQKNVKIKTKQYLVIPYMIEYTSIPLVLTNNVAICLEKEVQMQHLH